MPLINRGPAELTRGEGGEVGLGLQIRLGPTFTTLERGAWLHVVVGTTDAILRAQGVLDGVVVEPRPGGGVTLSIPICPPGAASAIEGLLGQVRVFVAERSWGLDPEP